MIEKLTRCRLWVMWVAAIAVVAWYWLTDPDGGAETIMRLQWLAWLCVAAGPVGPLPLLPFARLTATSLARRICGSLLTVKS